jgi:hypothetical protein
MIQSHDTIEGSGHPLGFCFQRDGERPDIFKGLPSETIFRVDARAMGAHQKEALVHEGGKGPAWRIVSDEGPSLKGSDMAPFPLGFFNGGLQADLLGQLSRLATSQGTEISAVDLDLDNGFSFSGSFFRGDGKGSADAAQLRLSITGEAPPEEVAELVRKAVQASPALAAMSTPLDNTFALYVNGIRREVTMTLPSVAADAPDPLKSYARPPSPLKDGKDLSGIVIKIPQPPVETDVMPPAASKLDIRVMGRSRLADIKKGVTEVQTWLKAPAGSHFGFRTDEVNVTDASAPSGLALLSAGVSFCYMTQLFRYVEYLKYKVRAIRLVQYNPFSMKQNADGSLTGHVGPVDTHLFLHADEPDEVMQRLLVMGAQTCYLHAALKAALLPVVQLQYNGQPLAFR